MPTGPDCLVNELAPPLRDRTAKNSPTSVAGRDRA